MKRCAKCILPANFPGITFDKNDVCNYCLTYTPTLIKGEESLKTLLDSVRGQGRRYDCLVLVSGGRDSSFVLSKVHEEFKMRTVALNYDSGFASEQAKTNLTRITRSLKVPLIIAKPRRDFQRQCLKRNIISWARNPSSELMPTLCFGCEEGYMGKAYETASRLGVPLIVTGQSKMESSIFKKALFRYHRSSFIHRLIKFAKNPFYLDPRNLYHYMSCYIESPMLITQRGSVTKISFFDYVEYDEKQMMAELANLGWEKDRNLSSSWRFDCKIHAIADYMFFRKLSFSEKDVLYSRMIWEGRISQTEALERLEREKRDQNAILRIVNEVLSTLDLSEEEVDSILFC